MNDFIFKRIWGPVPKYPLVQSYQRKESQKDFILISGPCSVESETQIHTIASEVAKVGATHLRGGLFRAGTYPGHNFGLVSMNLVQAFQAAAHANNLKNIIEVLDYRESALEKIAKYADCFQVGCRQMQNYTLLRVLGSYKKPVFLKRHPGSTIDEWLGAAEHLLVGGCEEIYLIERGSSTNANHVRWDLSISIIPAAKAITQIPIICDPSHGTGRRDLVVPMALAGVAAGCDGLLVEVHTNPNESISDADQAITPENFKTLIKKVKDMKHALL